LQRIEVDIEYPPELSQRRLHLLLYGDAELLANASPSLRRVKLRPRKRSSGQRFTDGDSNDGDSNDGDSNDGDSSDGDSSDGDSSDGDSSDGGYEDSNNGEYGDSNDGTYGYFNDGEDFAFLTWMRESGYWPEHGSDECSLGFLSQLGFPHCGHV
jgi:hypothetical protein